MIQTIDDIRKYVNISPNLSYKEVEPFVRPAYEYLNDKIGQLDKVDLNKFENLRYFVDGFAAFYTVLHSLDGVNTKVSQQGLIKLTGDTSKSVKTSTNDDYANKVNFYNAQCFAFLTKIYKELRKNAADYKITVLEDNLFCSYRFFSENAFTDSYVIYIKLFPYFKEAINLKLKQVCGVALTKDFEAYLADKLKNQSLTKYPKKYEELEEPINYLMLNYALHKYVGYTNNLGSSESSFYEMLIVPKGYTFDKSFVLSDLGKKCVSYEQNLVDFINDNQRYLPRFDMQKADNTEVNLPMGRDNYAFFI